jgi:hypothetical protein
MSADELDIALQISHLPAYESGDRIRTCDLWVMS